MSTNYGDWALKRAKKLVGPEDAWRLGESRQEGTTDDEIQNAFAVVSSEDLHLRFVTDRGVEHLDIGCLDAAGSRQWVPFEVMGLAAKLWTAKDFRKSQDAWCRELDFGSGRIECIELFDNPLIKIRDNRDDIVRIANAEPQTVDHAQYVASTITAEVLEGIEFRLIDSQHPQHGYRYDTDSG